MITNSIKRAIAVGISVAVALSMGAMSMAAVEKAPATIAVNASAYVYVSPDYADVSFGVETRDKSATKAQSANAAAMKKVIAAIKKLGVAEKDIETSNMYMYPTYDYQTNEPKITGYSVSNTITVTVQKLENVSAIVNAAMDAGANTLQGVNFNIKDSEDAYQNALKLATQKAAKRAKVLADAAGVQLDGLAAISDAGATNYYPTARSAANMNATTEDAAPASKIGDTIQPGKLEVSATVVVTYYVK